MFNGQYRKWSLRRAIDVFDLSIALQIILISRKAAEEDGAADGDDGGAPAEPVGPGVVIVAFEDYFVKFDRVDDQSDDLDDDCRRRDPQTRCHQFHSNINTMSSKLRLVYAACLHKLG